MLIIIENESFKISNLEFSKSFGYTKNKFLQYSEQNLNCCTGLDTKTNQYIIFTYEHI